MVSWTAAMASLRYFLPISLYLHKVSVLHQIRNLFISQLQNVSGGLFELFLFVSVDVGPLAFRKAVNENRTLAALEKDDRTITAGLPLSRARDPLLDDTIAEVGIDLPPLRSRDHPGQNCIADLFLSGKPLEPFRFENSGLVRFRFYHGFYSTRYYASMPLAISFSLPISLPTLFINQSQFVLSSLSSVRQRVRTRFALMD